MSASPAREPALQNPHRPHPQVQARPRSACTLLPGVGSMQQLLRLLGHDAPFGDAAPGLPPVPVLRIQPGGTLLHEGTGSSTLYVVRSGSFKCQRVLEDGYEQVLGFAQPGELLGCESLYAGARQATVVALEVSTVYGLAAGDLRALQQRWPLLEEALCRGLSRQLSRASETAELMVAVASEVRLARFVLWLAARMAEGGQSGTRLRLRMSRRDIASMLGVAHETVSRSFGTLAEAGYLRVDNRDVEILDLQGLKARARSTRAGLPEPLLRHTQRPAGPPAPDGPRADRQAPPLGGCSRPVADPSTALLDRTRPCPTPRCLPCAPRPPACTRSSWPEAAAPGCSA